MPYAFEQAICDDGLPLFPSPYVPGLGRLSCVVMQLDCIDQDIASMEAAGGMERFVSSLKWEVSAARQFFEDVEWTPDPSTYDYWERVDTGEVFGVRLWEGRITGMIRPLDWQTRLDIVSLPEANWERHRNQVAPEWGEKHRGEFRVVEAIRDDRGGSFTFEEGEPVVVRLVPVSEREEERGLPEAEAVLAYFEDLCRRRKARREEGLQKGQDVPTEAG